VYLTEPALAAGDCDPAGFRWIIGDDDTHSVFAWLRTDPQGEAPPVLAVVNATPTVHHGYRIGVPSGGRWVELLNSDAEAYDGSGIGNLGAINADAHPWHGYDHSLPLTVPPLGVVLLRPESA
jgi:1,4-alpha-glucan branching enzyme